MNKRNFHIISISKTLLLTSIIAFGFLSFQNFSDNNDSLNTIKRLRKQVLEENKIGKTFFFKLEGDGENGCNSVELKYLGIIETNKKINYKLLNCAWTSGYSCRGINRLLIYDTNNVYIGNYHMGFPTSLPDSIIGTNIVYNSNHSDCTKRKGTKISFKSGLPKSFQVCQDPYYFQGDE